MSSYDDLVFLAPRETFDALIIGIDQSDHVVIYDYDAIVRFFTAQFLADEPHRDEIDAEMEAIEHVDFNIVGAYMGDRGPRYVSRVAWEIEQNN